MSFVTHFLHLLPFVELIKLGYLWLRPFNQYEVHPHIAHLTNLHVYDFL